MRGDGPSISNGAAFKRGLFGNSGSDWNTAQGTWKTLMLPHRVGLSAFTTGDALGGRFFAQQSLPLYCASLLKQWKTLGKTQYALPVFVHRVTENLQKQGLDHSHSLFDLDTPCCVHGHAVRASTQGYRRGFMLCRAALAAGESQPRNTHAGRKPSARHHKIRGHFDVNIKFASLRRTQSSSHFDRIHYLQEGQCV